MMPWPQQARIKEIVAAALVFTFPCTLESGGIISIFAPIPVFYLLTLHGMKQGGAIIAMALVIAGCVSMIAGSLFSFLFTLTYIPLGWALAYSASRGEAPWQGGARTALLLIFMWALFLGVHGLRQQVNPYAAVQQEFDKIIDTVMIQYKETAKLAPEGKAIIAEFMHTRFPGLLLGTMLIVVWSNMTLGLALIKRKVAGPPPWSEFSTWRLPDALVWAVILTLILHLVSYEPLRLSGYNSAIVLLFLYAFQGLSVLAGLLARWNVPKPLRFLMYILLVFQGLLGLTLLAFIGLSDIWVDFAKLRSTEQKIKLNEA